jgi:hypothetical protein
LPQQVPYEILNKRFRSGQKVIDREASHVAGALAEVDRLLIATADSGRPPANALADSFRPPANALADSSRPPANALADSGRPPADLMAADSGGPPQEGIMVVVEEEEVVNEKATMLRQLDVLKQQLQQLKVSCHTQGSSLKATMMRQLDLFRQQLKVSCRAEELPKVAAAAA